LSGKGPSYPEQVRRRLADIILMANYIEKVRSKKKRVEALANFLRAERSLFAEYLILSLPETASFGVAEDAELCFRVAMYSLLEPWLLQLNLACTVNRDIIHESARDAAKTFLDLAKGYSSKKIGAVSTPLEPKAKTSALEKTGQIV
jgi:hypothetical protein